MTQKLTKSPRLNKCLYNMGIFSYYDVLNHLPYRYDDLHATTEGMFSDKQKVVIEGKIVSLPHYSNFNKTSITSFDILSLDNKYYHVIGFNRPYLIKSIVINDIYTIAGTYNLKKNEISLINLYKGIIPNENKIKPIYSLPQIYQNHLFISLVKRSFQLCEQHLFSLVPYEYQNKYRLISKRESLKNVHFPLFKEHIRQGMRHLKYEEALVFSLKNLLIKDSNKSLIKIKKEPIDITLCEPFIRCLPFTLTEDQLKTATEIIDDMNQKTLMYRILQGDVGSGKTLVSFIALFANYLRGDQGALMAPTDALAKQHYENAKKYFSSFNINVALLVGSTPHQKKQMILSDLKEGYIDIVIGTHSLFTKTVSYSSLGLAIIDEQHRFGVNQRIKLSNKGNHTDLLMMSATPIPRSLALTLFSDLDISTINTFPKDKRHVKTIVSKPDSPLIHEMINASLRQSKLVYIVAPLIEEGDNGHYSVELLYSQFDNKFPNLVGLLHGKMSSEEKETSLHDFINKQKPILVTTQVIEVGIDVRDADLMIIYDASHFGLSSLHQLRGRVGRDGNLSHCVLIESKENDEQNKKLEILAKTDDGFVIAQEDLKNRGPGELSGIKQSGLPTFCFLNPITDLNIFVAARNDAKEILINKEKHKWLIDHLYKEIFYNPLIKG